MERFSEVFFTPCDALLYMAQNVYMWVLEILGTCIIILNSIILFDIL